MWGGCGGLVLVLGGEAGTPHRPLSLHLFASMAKNIEAYPALLFSGEYTMTETLLELAYRLEQAREPFVLATVVWCERPTSAKPGAQAIIRPDGSMTG